MHQTYPILYAAYGANTNREHMRTRCPTATYVGNCTLHDFALVFRGVADVIDARGEETVCALWEIQPKDERALDTFEGFPFHYTKRYARIQYRGQSRLVMFYVMAVFSLSWGTNELGFARQEYLIYQMIGVLFFAMMIPPSAALAGRVGQMPMLIAATLAILAFGLVLGRFFHARDALAVVAGLSLGFACMGLTYGPLGTALAELFPTAVRYTGASIAFNVAGILGGSLAPYIATSLAKSYGIAAVGYYLSAAATVTLAALVAIHSRERARSVAAEEMLPPAEEPT